MSNVFLLYCYHFDFGLFSFQEAEIARLEAKLSGYERATFGMKMTELTPRSTRRSSHRRSSSIHTDNENHLSSLNQSPNMYHSTSDLNHINQSANSFILNQSELSDVYNFSEFPSKKYAENKRSSLNKSSRSHRSSRSNMSGVYSNIGSDSESDLDSFQSMYKHVQKINSRIPVMSKPTLNGSRLRSPMKTYNQKRGKADSSLNGTGHLEDGYGNLSQNNSTGEQQVSHI